MGILASGVRLHPSSFSCIAGRRTVDGTPSSAAKVGTALQFSVQLPLACGHMSSQPRPTAGTLSAGRKSLKIAGKMVQGGPQLDGFRHAALLLTAAATAAASAVAAAYWWRCCKREAARQESKRQAGALHNLTRFVSPLGISQGRMLPGLLAGQLVYFAAAPASLAVCPAQNEASREPHRPHQALRFPRPCH